jgi:hypothetical protein
MVEGMSPGGNTENQNINKEKCPCGGPCSTRACKQPVAPVGSIAPESGRPTGGAVRGFGSVGLPVLELEPADPRPGSKGYEW